MSLRLSPSLAKVLLQQSPAHAYLEATKPREPRKRSAAMRFGAAVDRLVFDVGDKIVTVKPYTAKHELPGQILVTEKELERAKAVADSVHKSKVLGGPVFHQHTGTDQPKEGRITQWKLAWFDKELYIELVSRPDLLCIERQAGYDLKTCHDISDWSIRDAIERYGYDIQAAAYLDAMRNCLGWESPSFAFVFAQTQHPYLVKTVIPDTGVLGGGLDKWNGAKQTWKTCLDTGVWPGDLTRKQLTRKQWMAG